MRLTRKFLATVASSLCLVIVSTSSIAHDCPESVRIAFSSSALPPFVEGEGTNFQAEPGLFVEWAQNAVEILGCSKQTTFVRLPYQRIHVYLVDGDIDFRVTEGFKPELSEQFAFPLVDGKEDRTRAVAESQTALYVREDDSDISWNGSSLTGSKAMLRVATVRGSHAERVLQAAGVETFPLDSWGDMMRMLQLKRVDALVGPRAIIEDSAAYNGFRRLSPPVAVDSYYVPGNKAFVEKYPDFTQHFWAEMCEQSRSFFDELPKCPEFDH